MAYTTEEQDFKSFMAKVRQYLPLIIMTVAVGLATYAAVNWYKNYSENQKIAEYEEYKRIMTIQNDGSNNDTIRTEMLVKYLNEHPEKALAAVGVMNQAQYYADQGKYDEALKLVSAIPAKNDYSPELVALTRAKLLLQVGRGEEGIPALDTVTTGSWYVNARILAGDIYFTSLKYDQALAEYTKAREFLERELAHPTEDTNAEDLNVQIKFVQSRINIVQSANKNK